MTATTTDLQALEETPQGTWIARGLRVFKVGTFRDSRGCKRTWTGEQLQQMVQNFRYLRDAGTFANVPVRADHTQSVKDLVGWFADVRFDGTKFLEADVEFTEPEAAEKYRRKTFRNRSLEVGAYLTNEDAVFFPTVLGLAFVDIGAVEGLHSAPSTTDDALSTFSQVLTEEDDKEPIVSTGQGQGGTPQPQPAPQPQPTVTPPQPQPEPQPAPPAPTATQPAPQPAPTPQPQPQPVAQPAPQPAPEPQPQPQPQQQQFQQMAYTFHIHGQPTQDFGAVQHHIQVLEQFVADHRDAARREFVNGLVQSNRILANDAEKMTTFVLGLTDEQFRVYREANGALQAPALFGTFGQPTGGQPPAPPVGGGNPLDEQIKTLEETIAMHRRTLTEEQVQATNSYKQLQQLIGQRNGIQKV